jgi:protein TonB
MRNRDFAPLLAASLAGLALTSGAMGQDEGEQVAAAAATGDRAPIPLVRIAPDYPARALAQGLEGSCTVDYIILADGSVDPDAIVADCTHELFIEPAQRAVARWTFSPAIAEGAAVARTNFRSMLNFSLAE